MAQTDIRRAPAPPSAADYDQLEAYHVLEHLLAQPIHYVDRPQDAPFAADPPSAPPTSQPAPFAQYTSLVGRTIASPSGSRFRLALRRVLGVGAYGVVYLAEEIEREERRYGWFSPATTFAGPRHEREQTISTAGRMYAVKVMRCAPRGSRQRAFQAREVALHRRADGHPGVVPLHAVYGTGNPPAAHSSRKRKSWSSHSLAMKPEDILTWDRDAELSGEPLPILENGQREELVYMVLSYVGGGDLFTMIAERHRYIGHDALVTDVFIQLLDAVAWCHERGVKHRDLKPENILCDHDGRRVVISDFGLATTDRWSGDFGCGSSYYMSPECYGDPLSPATVPKYDTLANDVWTLGVVLVNLTTGRNPWEAASPADPTFKSFCADPAAFLMSILPITSQANAVFTRIFERDQTRRCSLAELRELVLGVERWTLRGVELDYASEGARDVARGCGLIDFEPEIITRQDTSSGSSSGSSDMGQRSRFSEDTVFEDDEPELGFDEAQIQEHVDWNGIVPHYPGLDGLDQVASSRSESACSHSSLEMSRSRPASKILSHSPELADPEGWGTGDHRDIMESQHTAQQPQGCRSESIPRWSNVAQGSHQGEDVDGQSPCTPPFQLCPSFVRDTPRTIQEAGTPKVGFRDTDFGTPQSTLVLRTPKSSKLRLDPDSTSPFQSRIPRYTGSPRARAESAKAPSKTSLSPNPVVGRQRMWSAPLYASIETPKRGSKISTSTISAASSESGVFPLTPLKAKVVLTSPDLIISHPSDGTLWDVSRSSGRSLWHGSCDSRTTVYSADSHGRSALDLGRGAHVCDVSREFLVGEHHERDRNKSWNAPAPSTSSPTARRRYHTTGEDIPAAFPPIFAQRTAESAGSPKQHRVKRVPVPPIPDELLQEHERQILFNSSKGTSRADRVAKLSVDVAKSQELLPPPGLALNGQERQLGPRRLLENARAWFRRA